MHFQEIRRAAAQGTISLPPPMDSEGLEDLAVLKSCLKVIRELSEFRYAFAKDAMAETFAPLMASVEAKNELERQGLKVSLKDYFLSLILKDLENPDIGECLKFCVCPKFITYVALRRGGSLVERSGTSEPPLRRFRSSHHSILA